MHLATPLFRRSMLSSLVVLACASPAFGAGVGTGDLLVTSDATNICQDYSGTSGNLIGVFSPSILGISQMAVHFHPSNGRVMIGHSGGGVDEFDGTTGAYLKTYNTGGGWQWAGVYAPSGEVLIGDMLTNDVRRYDATTGAFIAMLAPIPSPADMDFGPNGNLYVCSFYGGAVFEVDPVTGGVLNTILPPSPSQPNDVAWNPANGEMLVSDFRASVVHRYSYPGYAYLGSFAGTGWITPHGVAISPHNGHILAIAGNTGEVHEFDPLTYVELNPAFLSPNPGLKIVDLAFAPGAPTPVKNTTSWGRLKSLYRR